MTTYDLGELRGGAFHQYANAVGQYYYYDKIAKTTSFAIPKGYEDNPQDTWTKDMSRGWPLWKNDRTGRGETRDPKPPPPQSYLDIDSIKAAFELLEKVPESDEHVYRRPTGGVLRYIFPPSEGFEVVQETEGDVTRSDFCTFKVTRRPGGSLYQYEYMHTECKAVGESWATTEAQHREQLAGNGNESKQCYGSIQIGLEWQFYVFKGKELEKVGGRLHMVHHHQELVAWGLHLKANPLPFV